MSHHVAILAYDGLRTFEFGCAIELYALDRPELGIPWYSYAVCAAEPGPLRAAGGFALQVAHGLEAIAGADTIVIPGWSDIGKRPSDELLSALSAASDRGARMCSICTGAYVLAYAGLLDGRRATTHWHFIDEMAQRFPAIELVPDVLYVEDGSFVTSAGSAAGLDMMLHLVRSDYGPEVANRVAQRLVVPAHRDGAQAQRVVRPLPARESDDIARLMDRVRENPRAQHTVASMAESVKMAPRTFLRRFKERTGATPLAWLVRERVTLAERLLETRPGLGIGEIADLAGLGSEESLRRHFRGMGLPPPARYRRQRQAGIAAVRVSEA
jgi:AraC family transcriptional activator FtrA